LSKSENLFRDFISSFFLPKNIIDKHTLLIMIGKIFTLKNKNALVLTGMMGISIPLLNGVVSGLWIWKSQPLGHPDSFFVDFSWLVIGLICLFAALAIKPSSAKIKANSSQSKAEKSDDSEIERKRSLVANHL
jgi:hypothetical protein